MEHLQGNKDKDEKVKDKDREETVDEKIERLGKEVEVLQEQVKLLRTSLPPITRPPAPEPLLRLRRAIKEKDMERELLLEDQRASKVVEEYLQENPSILEQVDDCPICLEPIFGEAGAPSFLCCGKKICRSCSDPLYDSSVSSDTCPLCRQELPSEGEQLSIVSPKAAEGKAWAQCKLGVQYDRGWWGLAVDKPKAESLFRSAADQGYSHAKFLLGVIETARANYSEACRWWEAAGSQGHMNALGHLGVNYYMGCGVAKDDMKAVRLMTVSSKLQTTERRAHEMLGECFALGVGGLDVSMVRAVYYMKPSIEGDELLPESMILYASILQSISKKYYPNCTIPPSGDNNMPEALLWYRRANAKAMNADPYTPLELYELLIKELCACCYKTLSTDKPKCCVECKAAYYCSRECQAADWKAGHKKDCVKSLKKRLRATGKFDDI